MILLLAALLAVEASSPPPSYVVERLVTVGDQTRRLSVFRDGAAVLSSGPEHGERRVVRQTLGAVEQGVIAQVVAECYADVARFPTVGEAPGAGTVELRLAPAGKPALDVVVPLTAARTLGVARLVQALDNLEARLARETRSREDLSAWEPAVGERVELEDGRVVEVVELLDADDKRLVLVRIGDSPSTIFMPEDELRRVAVRRIRP
ncbi:MAG TPA: hypothetical protein VLW17_05205 [Thermoanaerobaculaceae bacterium]|nr:hypothetical protein [Thermoanaerobaculaceae bacterium]